MGTSNPVSEKNLYIRHYLTPEHGQARRPDRDEVSTLTGPGAEYWALWNRTPVPACLLCWSLVSSLGPGPLHPQDSGDQCHTPPGIPCQLLLPFKMPCSRAHSGALSPHQIGTYIFIFQMSLKKFSKRR